MGRCIFATLPRTNLHLSIDEFHTPSEPIILDSSLESIVPYREPFKSSHIKLRTQGCAIVGPNVDRHMICTNKVDIP